MTANDADDAALRDQYRDLSEIGRGPALIRYSAALSDGAPVVVFATTPELGESIRHPDRFLDTLARASSLREAALGRPLTWGRSERGTLHCSFPTANTEGLVAGTQSAKTVAHIGAQLARGLSAAHEAGIPHGAICTDRIAQSSPHVGRLDEFGLFAALCAGGASVRDATAALCGAPYVSPEQEAGAAAGEPSDVYALGASLFELLTGKPPFGGRTTSYTMATVLAEKDAEGADDANRLIVVNALLRAIERAPDDRWSSAAAFANALENATTGRTIQSKATPRSGVFAIFRDAWFRTRRSRE